MAYELEDQSFAQGSHSANMLMAYVPKEKILINRGPDDGASLIVRLLHCNRDAPPKMRLDRRDNLRHPLATRNWLPGRTYQAQPHPNGRQRRKQSFERSKLAFLSCGDERILVAAPAIIPLRRK